MKLKNKFFSSVRVKLFFTLVVVIIMIIAFFIIINNAVVEALYYYKANQSFIETFDYINDNYKEDNVNISTEIEKMAINKSFEIIIFDGETPVLITNKNYLSDFEMINEVRYDVKYNIINKADILYANNRFSVRRTIDRRYGLNYLLLEGTLDSGNKVYIRRAVTPIQDNVDISNRFIYVIGLACIVLGSIAITFITQRFSKPIEELNDIANEMSNLNFKRKYRINDSEDEINELGKSINTLSDKLEETINQLKVSNSELERDIEEKSKIDEMRKQFISDVSHELKTPIALIQGYAEGLVENVASDEESRQLYTGVIIDEANKMDKLVKSLLELMKLEYGEREFNNQKFNLVELINEVIRNSDKVIKEQKINVEFNETEPVMVYADDFYIDQVVTNYFTNAIKNVEEVDKKKLIKISISKGKDEGKVRVKVFNTGKNIEQENLNRIWNRFYKVDESRDRSKGGTGIGLSIVKAIMTQYKSKYGVTNKKDGVEFYFEIAKAN